MLAMSVIGENEGKVLIFAVYIPTKSVIKIIV
jgi:hypothetical protein